MHLLNFSLFSGSAKNSSTSCFTLSMASLLGAADQRADLLALDDAADVALLGNVEDDDGDVVLFAEGEGGLVHDAQVPADAFVEGQMSVAIGVSEFMRVFVIDAVYVRGLENSAGADFVGAQGSGGIGGEERVAGAAGQHDDAPFFQVASGAAANERLGDLRHRNRAHHACRYVQLLQRVLQRHAVDDRAEHAHVVRGGALHAGFGGALTADDVARAGHHRDLHARFMGGGDLDGDGADGSIVEPYARLRAHLMDRLSAKAVLGGECLAGELQEHAPPAQPPGGGGVRWRGHYAA